MKHIIIDEEMLNEVNDKVEKSPWPTCDFCLLKIPIPHQVGWYGEWNDKNEIVSNGQPYYINTVECSECGTICYA